MFKSWMEIVHTTTLAIVIGRFTRNFFLKATSHSTIFDIPMRRFREDQKHRHRFTRSRKSATPVMVIIPLNFARCSPRIEIVKCKVAFRESQLP